jgi:hypothetical protein
MTIQELYDSVAQLGFETSLESNERFVYAYNRAILQVNRIKPLVSVYKLNHFPLKNLIEGDNFEPICKDNKDVVFIAKNAKSYYFECNGKGYAKIEKKTDNEWKEIAPLQITLNADNGRFKAYTGFIRNNGAFEDGEYRIRFIGDYMYYIKNVAMYGSIYSDNKSDIPEYSRTVAYDINSLTDDFMSFVCPPIAVAKQGKAFTLNEDYYIQEKGKILFPVEASGAYDIQYNRKPKQITLADIDDNTLVDLSDEELCAIMPNLIASYIWVDDEPDKAQYYLSLYREQVAEINALKRDIRPVIYTNKTGW